MPVPTFDHFFVPVLKVLKDGKERKTSEIYELVKDVYPLDEESYMEQIPSGDSRYKDRVSWAMTYLRKGELIKSPRHGYQIITKIGLDELENGPDDFQVDYLTKKYPKILEYHKGTKQTVTVPEKNEDLTPTEMMDLAAEFGTDIKVTVKPGMHPENYSILQQS